MHFPTIYLKKDEAMTEKPCDFNPETAPPSLTIDWEAYLPFLENEDIADEHKRELIEALWAIVVGVVDLGFGVHPIQQVCGKDISLAEWPKGEVVNSKETSSKNSFNKAARGDDTSGGERSRK